MTNGDAQLTLFVTLEALLHDKMWRTAARSMDSIHFKCGEALLKVSRPTQAATEVFDRPRTKEKGSRKVESHKLSVYNPGDYRPSFVIGHGRQT